MKSKVRDDVKKLLVSWREDPQSVKKAFMEIAEALLKIEGVKSDFVSRKGVSHSLRVSVPEKDRTRRSLFAIVDVVDDDPSNRWLSVCFYEDSVTDPEGVGNLVPDGLLGEDGYCFDVTKFDRSLISYIKGRIGEAYLKAV